MKILSVNVALPEDIEYHGQVLNTSIFKRPVQGPVNVHCTHLAGDRQASQDVHGGEHKAVYLYSHDHYPWWCEKLGLPRLNWGQFGENLTVADVLEPDLCIGDRLRTGSVLLEISGPRIPCQKLALRFGNPAMPGEFTASQRCGFYLRVLATGTVQRGQTLIREPAARPGPSVLEFFRAYTRPRSTGAREILERASTLDSLDPALKPAIVKRLNALENSEP
ncbi:MAG: MOSC domain-containing protein [Xanthomonadales bacterium]|nr:MOSC domain-containing protein [Xanthomonadales bacterium]